MRHGTVLGLVDCATVSRFTDIAELGAVQESQGAIIAAKLCMTTLDADLDADLRRQGLPSQSTGVYMAFWHARHLVIIDSADREG
jgi:hypothetical protein